MSIRVAINGYGRIGRCVLRALYESGRDDIKVVAINDLAPLDSCLHLTRYDTTHGRFNADVLQTSEGFSVNGDDIRFTHESEPAVLPWAELAVDVVLECTGLFTDYEQAAQHIQAGAKKVLISAPGDASVKKTIVYGINHDILTKDDVIVSNASCTTNCMAPMLQPLNDAIGIKHGLLTTIHAYTNDQVLTDTMHADPHRARAAGVSMIPTTTGAAKAVGRVLPELAGKLDGYAMRVPTLNVSVVDMTLEMKRATSVEEIDQVLQSAADGKLKNILRVNREKLVSTDFNHTTYSSHYDATQTIISDGTLLKVLCWYDNEWAFSNRMLDTLSALHQAK
jgi:glyceraldehyde 3-phosphate dehydrogenase